MISPTCDFFLNFVAALGDTTGGHSVQSPLVEDNAQQGTKEGMGRDADGRKGAGAGVLEVISDYCLIRTVSPLFCT
jgi:hypothetical protein